MAWYSNKNTKSKLFDTQKKTKRKRKKNPYQNKQKHILSICTPPLPNHKSTPTHRLYRSQSYHNRIHWYQFKSWRSDFAKMITTCFAFFASLSALHLHLTFFLLAFLLAFLLSCPLLYFYPTFNNLDIPCLLPRYGHNKIYILFESSTLSRWVVGDRYFLYDV